MKEIFSKTRNAQGFGKKYSQESRYWRMNFENDGAISPQ